MAVSVLIIPSSVTNYNNKDDQLKTLVEAILANGYDLDLADRANIHTEQLASHDIILLEIAKPADVEYCREIRMSIRRPVLLYGNDIDTSLWLEGVYVGADGYVDKSMDPPVILAKMQALLRRTVLA